MGKHLKIQVSLILIAVMVFTLCQSWSIEGTFAEESRGPDITVTTTGGAKEGEPLFTSSGNIGQGLWYPGRQAAGILRINNNYSSKVAVESFGLAMVLKDENNKKVEDPQLYELFAKTMKLTVEKGNPMRFIESPIYEHSFYEMLYETGSSTYKGHTLAAKKFGIDKGRDIDLRYTVAMIDTGAPQNELQGLTATVKFLVNVQGDIPTGNDDGGKDRDEKEVFEEEPMEQIPDISGHWAHDCIVALLEHKVIQGYPDGTIRPDDRITRAETAVLVGKALGLNEKDNFFSGYIDPVPSWAKGYIIATSESEIFKGYPGKFFRPGKKISREEMTTALIRGFKKESSKHLVLDFSDKEKIGKWAEEYVSRGVEHEIIVGYPDNTFKPQNEITRAEAFTIICKLLGYHEQHKK